MNNVQDPELVRGVLEDIRVMLSKRSESYKHAKKKALDKKERVLEVRTWNLEIYPIFMTMINTSPRGDR